MRVRKRFPGQLPQRELGMNFSRLGQGWRLKTDILAAKLCEKKKLHCPHCQGLSQIIDSFSVSVDDAKLSVEPTEEIRAAGSRVGRFVSVVTHEGLSVTHWFPRRRLLNIKPIRRFAFIHSAAARRPKEMRSASHGRRLVCVVNLFSIRFFQAT